MVGADRPSWGRTVSLTGGALRWAVRGPEIKGVAHLVPGARSVSQLRQLRSALPQPAAIAVDAPLLVARHLTGSG